LNDFTKDELIKLKNGLEYLPNSVGISTKYWNECEEIILKLKTMIDNYCEHTYGVIYHDDYRMNKQIDPINHPVHYNSGKAICECGRKIECIDVTRHMDFNLGNSVKYIWRSEYKNGAEDIKKAIWYLNDYLTKLSTDTVEKSVSKSC